MDFERNLRTMVAGGKSKEFFELIKAIGESKSKQEEDDIMIHEALEKLAEEIDAWDQLSGIYADALEAAIEPDDQQRLWYNLARVLDERLGAADEAEQAYRQVLDMDDTDQNALEALDRHGWWKGTGLAAWGADHLWVGTEGLQHIADPTKMVELYLAKSLVDDESMNVIAKMTSLKKLK